MVRGIDRVMVRPATVSAERRGPLCAFAVPGDLGTPTGGYVYDRRLLQLLPQHGIETAYLQLPQRFPRPAASDLVRTAALFEDTPERAILLVDGLAYGCLPDGLIAQTRRKIVALVHHPLALETGLSPPQRDEFERCERCALAAANRVIATSPATATAPQFQQTSNRPDPGARVRLHMIEEGRRRELVRAGGVRQK
jgi:hypothetical protein